MKICQMWKIIIWWISIIWCVSIIQCQLWGICVSPSISNMGLVRPLFVASIALLTLMMTSMGSTIQFLKQMGILAAVGTCSNCSSSTGTGEAVQLLPLQIAICNLQKEAVIVARHRPQQQQHSVAWLWIQGDSFVMEYHQVVLLFPTALNEGMTWVWRCSTSSTASAARQSFRKRQTYSIVLPIATVCSFDT